MKKKLIKHLVSLTLVLSTVTVVMISCKKEVATGSLPPTPLKDEIINSGEPTITASDDWNQTTEDECDERINTIAYGLLELSKQSTFRAIVNEEVDAMFDDDDNVLMRTLNQRSELSDLIDDMSNTLTNYQSSLVNKLDGAVNGFSYYDEVAYTQIYIPNVETVNRNADPVICMNYYDDDVIPGIKLNGQGQIEYFEVDEEFAEENLVWVISLNETVDNDGEIPETSFIKLKDGETPQSSGQKKGLRTTNKHLRISNIKISGKKEGWANGRGDISHVTIHMKHSTTDGSLHCSTATFRWGVPFIKIGKGNLNTWRSNWQLAVNVLADLLNYWEYENEHISLLIYESDKRKKFGQTIKFYTNCDQSVSSFKSKQDPYGTIYVQKSQHTNSSGNENTHNLTGCDIKIQSYQ